MCEETADELAAEIAKEVYAEEATAGEPAAFFNAGCLQAILG